MPLTPPTPSTPPTQHLFPRSTRRAARATAPRTPHLALLALLTATLAACHRPDPAPLRGLYQGDPGALFDSLDFLPDNRVHIALHAHTHIHIHIQQGRYTLQGDTLELQSERTTERLLILPDGSIDGGPILGTYRLATVTTDR